MRVLIGTSGWQYRSWRDRFYPDGLPQRQWLPYYADRFDTVEVNNTFYRLPPPETFARWAEQTPDGFQVVVKASRFVSHIKRLKDPEGPVALFLEHAAPLGAKLGPVLVQLPPTFRADLARLDRALAAFAGRARLAVEFRHESWFADDVYRVLRAHGAALCLTDRRNVRSPLVATADWTYVRFHEGTSMPWPCYGRGALGWWAHQLATLAAQETRLGEAFVYFNNDPNCCAVANARGFALAAHRQGLEPSRVPGPREVHPG